MIDDTLAPNRENEDREGASYREGDRVYQPGERLDPPKQPETPSSETVEAEPIDPRTVAGE